MSHSDASIAPPALTDALAAVERLTLFQEVLADSVGAAFLDLLESLARPRPVSVRLCYGRLFRLLAMEGEFYRGEMVGDAWQNHLIDRLLDDENPFSLKVRHADLAEVSGASLEAAQSDLRALQVLFALGSEDILSLVASQSGCDGRTPVSWDGLRGPRGSLAGEAIAGVDLKRRFALASDWAELLPPLAEHYRANGTGLFARFRAFRWVGRGEGGRLEGVADPDHVRLRDLVGYDRERSLLLSNTAHFLAGYPANNVLLYGDRGTGKSSTVKALVNEFGNSRLRLIELPKQQLGDYPNLLRLLRHRSERCIVFVDDLSFEEHEIEFKHLKGMLEGGVEARPDNVVVYATSNRRHLVREHFGDRAVASNDTEIHGRDTAEEKLSLSDRFGITLVFLAPDQETFLAIVEGLARQCGLAVPKETLERRALEWAARHNGPSGRTARQFVTYLEGELALAGGER